MLGLVLAAALANGTYTYKTTYNGATLGTSTVQVQNDGTSISEHIAGSYMGTSGDANATLTLNGDLTPKAYKATGTMGGQAMSDGVSVENGTVNVTNARGETTPVTVPSGGKFIVVDLGSLVGFVALPEQMAAWNATQLLAVIPSMGQSLDLTPQAPPATGGPAGDTAVSFGGHTPFTIWYNAKSFVPDLISIPSQDVTVTRV